MTESQMISVRMIDRDSKEIEILSRRARGSCHFKKTFTYNNYEIQLRVDWDDIENGEPRLDADIKDMNTEKSLRKQGSTWHHTAATFDPESGKKTYFFEFLDLKLRLGIIRTMIKTITANAELTKGRADA